MSEPSQKCDNNAIFKQNYPQNFFISFKISYSCCFGFRENLEFPDFLQKKFYNIDSWRRGEEGKTVELFVGWTNWQYALWHVNANPMATT